MEYKDGDIIKSKICIIGRKQTKTPNGLSNTSELLFNQVKSINGNISQFIDFDSIFNNLKLISLFDIVILDELFQNDNKTLKYIKQIKKINNKINIVQINHLNWINNDYIQNLDQILQVHRELFLDTQKNKNIKINIPVFDYTFQVPDYFYLTNIEDRKNKFISISKFSEHSFDIELFKKIYNNTKIEIDFIGHFYDINNKKFNQKVMDLFEKTGNRFKLKYSNIDRYKIPQILNEYKYFILSSKDNIYSLQTIEQLRCGCKPFLFDKIVDNKHIITYSDDIILYNGFDDFYNKYKENKEINKYNQKKKYDNSDKFSFKNYKERLKELINKIQNGGIKIDKN